MRCPHSHAVFLPWPARKRTHKERPVLHKWLSALLPLRHCGRILAEKGGVALDANDKGQAGLTFIISIVPWFFPDLYIAWKLVLVIAVLLLSALLYCYRLFRRIDLVQKELNEIAEKHEALVNQFNEKRRVLAHYRAGFLSIDQLISVALQATKQDRLQVLYRGFLSIQSQIIDDER